jgi:hypothetical protein
MPAPGEPSPHKRSKNNKYLIVVLPLFCGSVVIRTVAFLPFSQACHTRILPEYRHFAINQSVFSWHDRCQSLA